ncbi:MAG: FtsH protease activity modulator HflK [Oscillospiraceae bacterium]|nr:FtsH protease activity modulator HflK [Oscillospiraceae bacterium]
MNINPDGSYSSGPFKSSGDPAKKSRPKFNLPGKSAIIVVVLVLLVLAVMDSYYTLKEDQYAVITTFGKPTMVSTSGLKFKLPFIQDVTRVSKTIQGFPLGYRIGSSQSVDEESLMITYDYNFVNVDFYVEYRVTDPIKFLYSSQDPVGILKMLCQSYIRDTIGLYNVDTVITTGKSEIQAAIKEKVMQRLEEEDIGLQLTNIRIQDAEPPTYEVQRAFTAVETAKQSADTTVNNAKKYANEVIPAAAADADQIIKSAEAYKASKINEASGQASRFAELFEEYQKYPLITKQRLFYEAMESILPGMKLYILDNDTGVQTALPLEQFATVNMGGEVK